MFHSIVPFRNSDTRFFGGPGMPANTPLRFGLNPDIFPKNTTAVAMNVAVVAARAPGYMTVWPAGPKPNTSVVNFKGDGQAYNGSIVTGVQDLQWMLEATQVVHSIFDITGYWTT